MLLPARRATATFAPPGGNRAGGRDGLQEARRGLKPNGRRSARPGAGAHRHRDAVVIEGESRDRRFVPARLLSRRPARIPEFVVEECRVQEQVSRDAGNPRGAQPVGPAVEDRVDVVVVEPSREVRVPAADDEERSGEQPAREGHGPIHHGLELVVLAEPRERRRGGKRLRHRGDRERGSGVQPNRIGLFPSLGDHQSTRRIRAQEPFARRSRGRRADPWLPTARADRRRQGDVAASETVNLFFTDGTKRANTIGL